MKNGVDYFSYTIQKRGNSHLDGPIAGSRHDLPVVGAEGNGEHVLCGERGALVRWGCGGATNVR